MKRIAFLASLLVCHIALLAGQAKQKPFEMTINAKDVFISMFHTPEGHVIQNAPLSRAVADHLNLGSGIESIKYSLVDGLRDFYTPDNYGGKSGNAGALTQYGGFTLRLSALASSDLYPIPMDLQSDAADVAYAVAVINGKLTKPSFINTDKTIFWLRPCIYSPEKNKDGELLIPFKKLEIALPVFFNKDCTLNGVVKAGGAAYQFKKVQAKQGWNLMAIQYPDGEQWKSSATVTVIPANSPLTWIYIPYWDF